MELEEEKPAGAGRPRLTVGVGDVKLQLLCRMPELVEDEVDPGD